MSNPERVLQLEGELQSLRLELADQKKTAAKLKQELERQREGESARLVAAKLENLLGDVAAPISQLLLQSYLLKVEDKPVQAKDVLAVANRLIRALEDHGLGLDGEVGQKVAYDPNRHEALSADQAFKVGQMVEIRLIGLTYGGRILRKAGVGEP